MADKQLFKIGEVARMYHLSLGILRHYEKEGLLTPARRQGNDYRDYTAGDVRTLKLIRMLRMLDVPLPTIKAVLRGEQPLQQALQAQQTVLEQQAAQLARGQRLVGTAQRGGQAFMGAAWRGRRRSSALVLGSRAQARHIARDPGRGVLHRCFNSYSCLRLPQAG